MSENRSNKQRYEDAYNEAMGVLSLFYEQAAVDYQFFVGDQWSPSEKSYLKSLNRDPTVFNYLRRFIKRVGGHQRKHRLATNIEPTETQDQYVAEIYDDLLKWNNKKERVYNKISQAFEKGALVTGWNLLHSYMDFSKDPINGQVKTARRGYNTFLIAPDFKELDLSDARYIITCDYMSKDAAKALLPSKAKEIDALVGGEYNKKFTFNNTERLRSDNIVAYVEFWERVSRERHLIMNNATGESSKWRGTKKELNQHVKDFPWITYITFYEPTVKQTIFIQDEEMYHGIDPYGSKERGLEFNEYPYTLVAGYFESDIDSYEWKMFGLARPLMWAQKEENKRKSQMFSILDSAPHGGYVVKNGAVSNIDTLYQSGITVITIDEAAQMTDLHELRPREIPQTTMLLSQQLKQDLVELGGGSEEFMGSADLGNSQVSGTLAKVRTSNTVESLQDLFDNLDSAQENVGMKHAMLMQIHFTPEHIKNITGKDVPDNFYDEDISLFDIMAAEGMLTDSNRNLAYIQSLQAKQQGVYIPDKFIREIMPIANKSRLEEIFQEEAQQQEQQQQKIVEQEEIAKRLANAETIHKLSLAEQQRKRGVADEALSRERISESKLNQARTIDTRMDASLKQIQMTKEIEAMDMDRMQSAIRFALEMYEDKRREELLADSASRDDVEVDGLQGLEELKITDDMRKKVEDPKPPIPQPQQPALRF